MPYIHFSKRLEFDQEIDNLVAKIKDKNNDDLAGTLNYIISRLTWKLCTDSCLCYARMNTIIGALECVKTEFYRRIAAPYENKKIDSEGDII